MINELLYIPKSQRKDESMSPEEQIAARQAREKAEEEERAKAVRARKELLTDAASLLRDHRIDYSAGDVLRVASFLEGRR